MRVELTARGDLIIPVDVAEACFPAASSVLVAVREDELWAMRMGDRAVGGLILKQRNLRGDRSVLVVEPLLDVTWDAGVREVRWDESERALRIGLRVAAAEETATEKPAAIEAAAIEAAATDEATKETER